GDNHRPELGHPDPRPRQGHLRRGLGHGGDGLLRPGVAPLPDAGALHDPLIRRLQPGLEVLVGHDPRREVDPEPGQMRKGPSGHAPASASRRANLAPMWALRSWATAWLATRMAFLKALGEGEPWQTLAAPFTPSSGAPPYSL